MSLRLTAGALALLVALSVAAAADAPRRVRKLDGARRTAEEIDADVLRLMTSAGVPGLALAVINEGRPVHVKAYGFRDVAEKKPLEVETILYGASLTKLAFAFTVLHLVDQHRVDLDRPIAAYLSKPLPDYPKYADLAGDARWKTLTPRMLLSHTSGFPNFRFVNADGKLDFKFDPGTRYAYSGEGINLLQFVLEEGLGLDVGKEMQKRVFDRFGMTRTSMVWRDDFAGNMSTGYAADGTAEGHHKRGSVRAAGSMDTTIADYAAFLAGLMRGEGLSRAARAEMVRPQIAIASAHQFPTLDPAVNPANRSIGLAAGLGSVTFRGPHGAVFFKGGHDDWTANFSICVEAKKSCVLLLSNSVRAEAIYPELVDTILGVSGMPWTWEYSAP